jgi:8-oxo-dGTP diphosphatase
MQMSDPVLEVDVAAFSIRQEQLHLLLVKRAAPPYEGEWALAGVRLGSGERLADAARRALVERTGLDVAYLEQLYTFDGPDRDPRGPTISVAYFALLPLSTPDLRRGRAVDDVAWWPVASLPMLAFDHAEIAEVARARVAAKVEYSPIAFSVLPPRFTMRDLRSVHEVLSGRPYAHENNFWRQMTTRWGLQETGQHTHGRGRPAALYHFPGAAPSEAAPAPGVQAPATSQEDTP